jgi:hypothetical protein
MATNFIVTTSELVAPAVLRLTFSQMPLSASNVGPNDSLNRLNYRVTGSSELVIQAVRPVKGDPFSVEVVGDRAFDVGQWVISFQNIQTALGQALETASVSLDVASLQKFFSPGAKNMSGEDVVRSNLNPIFDGPGWAAYVAATGYSDQKVQDLAKAAFFQNFLTTASDVYLEKLTTAISVDRAPNTGMSDDTLRELAIAVNANKVIVQPFLEVLQAYYGRESVVANVKAGVNEPFALTDGDTLLVTIDEEPMEVVFDAADFSNIGQATALEVVQVLNRTFLANGSNAYADITIDPSTSTRTVQIFSGRLGLFGSIVVTGGTAERVLRFPNIITTDATVGVNWIVMTHTSHPTLVPYGRAWIRFAGGTPNPAINEVFDNDYIVLHDPAFSAPNRGDFRIVSVGIYLGTKYIEIDNEDAVAESVAQATADGILFLDDAKTTINGTYFASAIQPWPEQVDVLLPATARAIDRTEKTGAYLNGEAAITIDPYEAFRTDDGTVQIAFPTDHTLQPGQFVQLQNFLPDYARDPYQALSYNTDITNTSFYGVTSVKLRDGRIFVRRDSDWAIFDPSIDKWSVFTDGSLASRVFAGSVLMNDGRVLIVGGSGSPLTSEIYDPEANAIVPTASMANSRSQYPQVGLLRDGRVVVSGGGSEVVEVYDPALSLWSVLSPTASNADRMVRSVITSDGWLVVMGGYKSFVGPSSKIAVFTPTAVEVQGNLPATRYAGTPIFVRRGPRGQIWYLGGYDSSDAAVNTVYVFDLARLEVVATYSLNYARAYGQITPLANGKFLLFGGTTLDSGLYFAGVSNGPPPELIDPFALVDSVRFRTYAPELTLNYEVTSVVQTLSDGRVLVASPLNPIYHTLNVHQQVASGGMHGRFKIVTTPTPDTITLETPNQKWRTNWLTGQVVPIDARKGVLQSGYLINTKDGVTITGTTTILSQQIIPGGAPPSILVSSVDGIPDAPGYLVFDFGTSTQSKPIRYLGVTSNQIRLDPSGVFEYTYAAGTEVTLLASKGVYAPASSLDLGVFYATASSAGRIAASAGIDSISGVGLTVNKTVLYPGDRGLGGQGLPAEGAQKLSDKVAVWGGDSITTELETAREGDGGA